MLEAAVEAREGAVLLVKVDVDANPGLSQEHAVSGIPQSRRSATAGSWRSSQERDRATFVDVFLDELLAPPRADILLEELRAAGEFPAVVAALDAGDVEGALRIIVEQVPEAARQDRDRLREVAVAIFERLGSDDPLVGTYRRRLAAALTSTSTCLRLA